MYSGAHSLSFLCDGMMGHAPGHDLSWGDVTEYEWTRSSRGKVLAML